MSDSSAPAIDPAGFARLEELSDGDVEFMGELLQQYLEDAESLVAEMCGAAEVADAERLERSAHTLKSASANVGAMVLSDMCKELQQMGRSKEIEGCKQRAAAAAEEFGRVRAALEERLAKLA